MKKIITLILALTLALCPTLLLTSCGAKTEYDNYDKYTPGDWAQTLLISAINVEWIKGKVEIVSHSYGYLACSETSESELSDEVTMHWYYDGTTLNIKPSASGTYTDKIPEKTLTIYVPGGYSFSDIDIKTVTADVSVEESGANFIEIETVSGNVSLQLDGKSQELDVETVTGEVNISSSVSKSIEISSSTGNVNLYNKVVPEETEIETVSGKIDYKLSEDSAFVLKCGSVSGSISNAFGEVKNNGEVVINNGTKSIELNTVSGDITIWKKSK